METKRIFNKTAKNGKGVMNVDAINSAKGTPMQPKKYFGIVRVLLTITAATMIGVLSTPAMYEKPPGYRVPIFAVLIGVLLILSGGQIGKFSKQRLWMMFWWGGFGSIAFVSGLQNHEDMIAALWLYLGVPYLIFCVFPQAAGIYGKEISAVAVVLAHLPYIIISLIQHPLSSPYVGVLTNPNLFGMMVATMSAGILALLRGAIFHSHKSILHWVWSLTLGLAVAAAFILIIKSSSRTSLITFAFSCLIFFWSLFFEARKNRFWIVLSLLIVIGTTSYFAVSVFSGEAEGRYFRGIVTKMQTKLESQDPMAGRFEIWKSVLADVQPFGYGTIGFPAHYGANAHNTYIMILGAMGPAALVFILSIHGMATYLALKMVFQNIRRDGYALAPLLIIANYIVLGFAELVFGILGNGINLSFLLATGILLNENWAEEKSMQNEGNNRLIPSKLEGETG